MTKRALSTWIVLLVLTIIAGTMSNTTIKYGALVILTLSAVKFIGVAYEFMGLKTAHIFWKIAITTYLVVFIGIVLIII